MCRFRPPRTPPEKRAFSQFLQTSQRTDFLHVASLDKLQRALEFLCTNPVKYVDVTNPELLPRFRPKQTDFMFANTLRERERGHYQATVTWSKPLSLFISLGHSADTLVLIESAVKYRWTQEASRGCSFPFLSCILHLVSHPSSSFYLFICLSSRGQIGLSLLCSLTLLLRRARLDGRGIKTEGQSSSNKKYIVLLKNLAKVCGDSISGESVASVFPQTVGPDLYLAASSFTDLSVSHQVLSPDSGSKSIGEGDGSSQRPVEVRHTELGHSFTGGLERVREELCVCVCVIII